MKLMHLSDLHLGLRLKEQSMLEDQEYILDRILELAEKESPDAVLIAGDVYDKSVPSAEAVALFDRFLQALSDGGRKIFVLSGNHDSAERIAFGSGLMRRAGVYMSPVYNGVLEPVTLKDEYGEADFFMLPFVKPIHVRRYFPEDDIETYTDAVSAALSRAALTPGRRSILLTHQFVSGAGRCDSETVSVGGTDNVDASAFDAFDYVALGHLHGPQFVERETLRYCGTPLKYSFSEAAQEKSVTIVELAEKGNVTVRTVPLKPLRDLRELRGTYDELMSRSFYEGTAKEDYLHFILTDEDLVPLAMSRMRTVYPNLLHISYDNSTTRAAAMPELSSAEEVLSPLDYLERFFRQRNGREMNEKQRELAERLFAEAEEELK